MRSNCLMPFRLAASLVFLSMFSVRPAFSQTRQQVDAARFFIEAIGAQDWDRVIGLEHPAMIEKMKPEQWKQLWEQLTSQLGPLRRTAFHSTELNRAYASVIHRAYFEKDSIDFRVVVDTLNLVGGFWVDQIKKKFPFPAAPYVDTTAFSEIEMMVGDGPASLPGTITIPKGKGPFPAVVLVHGSGPQDRDETLVANKPFRDIAWGLATRGILVLRYDKRTKVYPRGMDPVKITAKEEVVDDAIAAVKLLAKRKDVDRKRLSLVGHSLGAMLAPDIAKREKSVTGIAMLASPARRLETLVGDQVTHIASLKDTLRESEKKTLQLQLERVAQIENQTFAPNGMFLGMSGAYFYDLRRRELVETAVTLDIPILICQGGKDYQVPMKDYEIWREKLKGKTNVSYYLCENCYHLFIETGDKPAPANYEKQGHVAVGLIETLASWCHRKK